MNAVIEAFLVGKKRKQGNGQTDGRSLYLFGNLIAEHREDGMYVSNAGWPTRTTNKWLNMLPDTRVYSHKKTPYLNGEKWDGEMTKVNDNVQPEAKHVGEIFDMTCEYIRLDGWRGYSKPIYSVHMEPDTGGWDDSPYPNAQALIKEKLAELKAIGIPAKVVTSETSNVFCVNHFIIVPPKFYNDATTRLELRNVG
jgi:hypothetical protein